jgi:hypothetical protein
MGITNLIQTMTGENRTKAYTLQPTNVASHRKS